MGTLIEIAYHPHRMKAFLAQHARGVFPGGQLVVRRHGKTIVDEAIGLASGLRDGEPRVEVTATPPFR